VPAIADMYRRNRKQHDTNARKWTEQYAMPPPTVPVVEPSKKKAVVVSVVDLLDEPTPVPRTRTRSAAPARGSRLNHEPPSHVTAETRSRAAPVPQSSANNPIEIESSPEPEETERSASAQAVVGRKRNRGHEDGDGEGHRANRRRGNASGSRPNGHVDNEVIVLD
jgi:ubiquitin-conjugating enzyme E2 D/E